MITVPYLNAILVINKEIQDGKEYALFLIILKDKASCLSD